MRTRVKKMDDMLAREDAKEKGVFVENTAANKLLWSQGRRRSSPPLKGSLSCKRRRFLALSMARQEKDRCGRSVGSHIERKGDLASPAESGCWRR